MSLSVRIAIVRHSQSINCCCPRSPAVPAGSSRRVPQYAMTAVEEHGAWRGLWLAIRRVGRCHPLGGHGFDPVPPRTGTR